MKAVLQKYKWGILFWTAVSLTFIFFVPRQQAYYLDADIKQFSSTHLKTFLVCTGIAISLLVFILKFVKTKSIKRAGISLLFASLLLAFYLFIFRNMFLGASLYLNRQFNNNNLERVYQVSYLAGEEQTKDGFYPYDPVSKEILRDQKLKNQLYKTGLKQNDTLRLQLKKGLFGIPFQPQAFPEE